MFAGVVAIATHTGDSGGVGDARLTTKGRALVTAVNGQRRTVTGTVALHRGETVEAVDGAMTIELPDGSTVEGRPSFKSSDPTRVKVAQPVELLAGDLLVVASEGTDVDAGGNRVHLDSGGDGPSAARVSRSLAVGAAVYRGTATLDSAGQARAIPALRALEVSALGRPPTAASPLKVDDTDTDPWDRRLGEAIDLGHTLGNYAAAYTDTIAGGNGVTVGAYKQELPALADEADFTAALLAAAPPHSSGETFIGAAIASLSRRGSFADRWREMFRFRDAGANWGFVALDQGVASEPLLSAVQDALNAAPFGFALAVQTPPTAATASTAGGGPTTTPPTTPPGGPTTTPPTTPPTTTIVPPTGSPLVDGIVKNVNDLLGGLVGGRPPGGWAVIRSTQCLPRATPRVVRRASVPMPSPARPSRRVFAATTPITYASSSSTSPSCARRGRELRRELEAAGAGPRLGLILDEAQLTVSLRGKPRAGSPCRARPPPRSGPRARWQRGCCCGGA